MTKEDKKIVRKRIAIFYIVGLSLCFSDIAYNYISWEIKKADLVQVANTGVWTTPEKLKNAKINKATKNFEVFSSAIVKSGLKIEELEQKLESAQAESQKESIIGDIRREKYQLSEFQSLTEEFRNELKILKNEEV